MNTSASTDVIQGDEQSRDGHYRAKQDLREQAPASDAQSTPPNWTRMILFLCKHKTHSIWESSRVGSASEEAAGIPAIWNTMLYGIGEMGPIRSSEAFLKINHVTGFDCQSCAWPSPDKKRKIFEFCENGAKAVSDESTKKRITPEFFAQHSIADLAAQSDYWLNQQGRLTSPMVRHANATHYQPITWSEAFTMIADELNSLDSPDQAAFYTSGKNHQLNPPFCCSCLPVSSAPTISPTVPICATSHRESPMTETLGNRQRRSYARRHGEYRPHFHLRKQARHQPSAHADLPAKSKRPGAKIIAVNPLPEVSLMRVTNPNPQDYSNPLELPSRCWAKDRPLPISISPCV